MTDEVYEHLVFDGEHIPLATLPGMRDRTRDDLLGREDVLVHRLEDRLGLRDAGARRPRCKTAKQFLTYVSGGPFQYAIAVGLRLPDEYFDALRAELQEKRDRLCAGLASAGFTCSVRRAPTS